MEAYRTGDIPDEDGLGLRIRTPLRVHSYCVERYPFRKNDLEELSPGVVRRQIDWLFTKLSRNDARTPDSAAGLSGRASRRSVQ